MMKISRLAKQETQMLHEIQAWNSYQIQFEYIGTSLVSWDPALFLQWHARPQTSPIAKILILFIALRIANVNTDFQQPNNGNENRTLSGWQARVVDRIIAQRIIEKRRGV